MKSECTSEQIVYPQRTVATVIAERMTQIKGSKYGVVQIPQGFQVVPIQVLPDYVPPAKPKPVEAQKAVTEVNPGEAVFKFPLVGEGITYITVMHEGKQKAFGKSTLLGWEKDPFDGNIALKMSTAVAKKRGLIV